MKTTDINNLGNFANIDEVWAKYPEGGSEGDYLFINGIHHRWNKYDRLWENAETYTESTDRETKIIEGDLTINHDLKVGGTADVHHLKVGDVVGDLNVEKNLIVTNAEIRKDLKVNGTLKAKHIKQPNCGMFTSVEALKKAYPNPDVGMWAIVGNMTPAPIYRCDTEGIWTATGETGGVDDLNLEEFVKKTDIATTEKAGIMSAEDKAKLDNAQSKKDNALLTKSKEIVGAVNEVNSIAKFVDKSMSYTEEEGFFITDKESNVIFKILNGVIDALGIGDVLTEEILDKIKRVIPDMIAVDNGGVLLTDTNGNIGWQIAPFIVEEDGLFFTDRKGNIGISIKKGRIDFSSIGNFTQSQMEGLTKLAEINSMHQDLQILKDKTQLTIDSLNSLKKSGIHFKQEITIPALDHDAENHVVRIGLHYGSQIGNTSNDKPWNEVFFNGQCEKNFSDIKILEGEKILPCRLEHFGNYEVVMDDDFGRTATIIFDSEHRMYRSGSKGIYRSSDDAKTWEKIIDGKVDYFVGIDSHDNIYINTGTKVYMYNLGNIQGSVTTNNMTIVLDMFAAGGIESGGFAISDSDNFAEDSQGYVYIGRYQLEFAPVIYRSINPDLTPDAHGDYFKVCYDEFEVPYTGDTENPDYGKRNQHIHHLDICKATNTLFAGIDNSHTEYGPAIICSSDNGNTWQQVNLPDNKVWQEQRGRDYFGTWFSEKGDFSVFGGEVGILGGYTLCKSEFDIVDGNNTLISCKGVINTGQGIRNVNAFNDNFIVVGLVASGGSSDEAYIVASFDKGETWRSIYSENINLAERYAGEGMRRITDAVQVVGSKEPTIYVTSTRSLYHALRIYNGGNHYYGEMYVNVGRMVANQPKTLTIEGGYVMAAPKAEIYNRDCVKPVYSVLFNEGMGESVTDSKGNSHKIKGDFEWDKFDNNVRFGNRVPYNKSYNEMHGLMLKEGATINLGKIKELDFNKGFTLFCYIKNYEKIKAESCEYKKISPIIGTKEWGIGLTGSGAYAGTLSNRIQCTGIVTINFPNLYIPVAITVSADVLPQINVFVGDDIHENIYHFEAQDWSFKNLSENELIIGTDFIEDCILTENKYANYHYGNRKMYISSLRIYDRVLDSNELKSVWRGYNV